MMVIAGIHMFCMFCNSTGQIASDIHTANLFIARTVKSGMSMIAFFTMSMLQRAGTITVSSMFMFCICTQQRSAAGHTFCTTDVFWCIAVILIVFKNYQIKWLILHHVNFTSIKKKI